MADKLPQWKDGDLISASKMNAMVNAINDMEDGHTPVKGVDYFTEEDKQEMLEGYATESFVQEEILNAQLGGDGEVDLSGYVTEAELNTKQDKLVSGTNIKTINGASILGSGNITIEGSSNAGSVASPLPGYWKSYLNTKATGINAFNESLGSKGDAFIFITDTHIPNNYGNSIHAINELCRLTSINKIFFGGDMIASAGSASAMAQKARELVKGFDAHLEVHPMRGNHDTDHNASANQYWDAFFRNIGRYCEVDGNMYYCRDDKAVKVRYIIMDSIYTEGKLGVNLPEEEQLNWVKEKILELPFGWSALIVTHSIWIGTGAIGEAGQLILDAIDEVYDTARCTIIGVMCGHCHADKNATFDKGYIAFSSLYDYKGGTAGTTNEQVFDVVNIDLENGKVYTTRIGRGSNREFSYNVKADIPVTGVSLDTSSIVVGKELSKSITAQITPSNTINQDVTWEIVSGNENITINPNGLVCNIVGKNLGNAVVKVTTTDGGFEATCDVVVVELVEYDLTENFTWTNGNEIQYGNGNMVSDSRWSASNFVDVSLCKELTFNIWSSSSVGATAGYAFYDKNQVYISGAKPECTPSGYTEHTITVQVPSDAVYFKTTWYGSNTTNFHCEAVGIIIDPTGVSLDSEKTSYINEEFILNASVLPIGANSEVTWSIVSGSEYISITPNNKSCTVKCNAIGNAVVKATITEGFEATCAITVTDVPTLSEVDITDRFIFETGSVNYETGADNDDENYVRSGYTEISDCESLTLAMPQTTNGSTTHGIAFYDSAKKYISGVQILTGGSWSWGTKEVEVPNNAECIRVVFYGNNHPYLPSGITTDSFSCIAKKYE